MDRDRIKRKGNIVETYRFGNTIVHICDDCIVKTPEEKERVLAQFYAAGWAIVRRLRSEGHDI